MLHRSDCSGPTHHPHRSCSNSNPASPDHLSHQLRLRPQLPHRRNQSLQRYLRGAANLGRYKLVNSPEQADLVFQLRNIAPITDATGNHGGVYSVTSPAFQLTILDPKSNIALWTI